MTNLANLSKAQLNARLRELRDEISGGENTPIAEGFMRQEVTRIERYLEKLARIEACPTTNA